jgi:hypothetical protein
MMTRRSLGRFQNRSASVVAVLALSFLVCAYSQAQPQATTPKSSNAIADQKAKDAAFMTLVAAQHRPHPGDQALASVFNSHRADFEQLAVMSQVDGDLLRVANDFVWTTKTTKWPRPAGELGITQHRWDDYRRLFRLLHLTAGMSHDPEDPKSVVYLLASTSGFVTGGSVKGYARSDSVLSPLCKTLDSLPKSDKEEGVCFKPLAKGWYLYFQWD